MKLYRLIYLILMPVLFLFSCKKFLDVKPKGVVIAETIGDFEGLLNGANIVNPFSLGNLIIYPTDDLTDPIFNLQNQSSPKGNTYFWREYINNSSVTPDLWADLYTQIANLNVVTEGVLQATDGTLQKRKQLYAEAMVAKVYNYIHLISFFSPAYDKNTAGSDLGVPYVTSTDVNEPVPARPSLQLQYQRLIADLTEAIPDLPESNINNTRITKYVAYGLLSRLYMSMLDYNNALKYADLTLSSGKGQILNYNEYVGGTLPMTNSNAEELFVRYSQNDVFRYSAELLAQYDLDNDLRIKFLAELKSDGSYGFGGQGFYNPNRGITYAEIYLNKAECLARLGQINDALEIVNLTIRKNRFAPNKYTPLAASNTEEAINAVLQERRRELAFKGLRWIDMKRLDKENRMPVVNRMDQTGLMVLTSLTPGSTQYTYQIPLMVQRFNAGMPLNKR